MNELPPVATRMIRKSAYGRTQLFLPSSSTLLREVKCQGGVVRHDAANVYHVLPEVFLAKGPVACWHCCEEIRNVAETGIPLPRVYDSVEKTYHVYGITCSPGCAKSYILEHTTFDRGQHLNVLVRMLREIYGVTGPVVETPPRPALRRFGGSFDPAVQLKAQCRLVQPPFVSYTMLAEERLGDVVTDLPSAVAAADATAVEEADTFDEPEPPALFDQFMETQRSRRAHEGKGDVGSKRRVAAGSGAEATAEGMVAAGEGRGGGTTAGEGRGGGTATRETRGGGGPLTKFVRIK